MSSQSTLVLHLLFALIAISVFAILLVALLYLIRRYKRTQKSTMLPLHKDQLSTPRRPHHRRTASNISFGPLPLALKSQCASHSQEKQNLVKNGSSPPASPLPEIRITFPQEFDSNGRPQSARVVVVRVGEQGYGLEPLDDTCLPAYQEHASENFYEIDLDKTGGLKESS